MPTSGALPEQHRERTGSNALEDVQPVHAIEQVDQAPVVDRYVVALDARYAAGGRRLVPGDFPRRVGIGEIDDAQSVRKPGDGDFGAGDFFARLVAAGERGARRAVLGFDLKAAERHWMFFVSDVDHP